MIELKADKMLAKLIRRYPLAAYFFLAYAISWLCGWPAAIFPDWPGLLTFLTYLGPAIAALIVAVVVDGREGIRRLLSPLAKWRIGVHWYMIVLLGPAFMMAGFILLYQLLGKGSGVQNAGGILALIGSLALVYISIVIYQSLFVWGEEIGWRGYALPKLQEKFHPLVASVILGLLWGFWHLPSFFIDGSIHQGVSLLFYVLSMVGYSILYTWVYNGTGGSLLLICLLHAADNASLGYAVVVFPPLLEEPAFTLAALALFDLLVIAVAGSRLSYRESANLDSG